MGKSNQRKRKKNLSISEDVLDDASKLMTLLHYDNFSEFVSDLIRQEKQRRLGYLTLEGAK